MRIFLDANILFSAGKQPGAMIQLLHECMDFEHCLVIDSYVLTEARRNLERKFPEGLIRLQGLLPKFELLSNPSLGEEYPDLYQLLPAKDVPVLASAISGVCSILLTGDKKHFGTLYDHVIHGVLILSPAMLAMRITPSDR